MASAHRSATTRWRWLCARAHTHMSGRAVVVSIRLNSWFHLTAVRIGAALTLGVRRRIISDIPGRLAPLTVLSSEWLELRASP